MRKIRQFWRSLFDIRKGEGPRVAFMGLYLMLVLFAYYIIKPVSRAMFLARLDIDNLPVLYILIAIMGGLLAYFYTKLAVRTSLPNAVNWATSVAVVCLVVIWGLLRLNLWWMLYVFNIWVSLFSITMVSQGWLVAANVFSSREAKRLYGILGVGAVVGAAFGGSFTALLVPYLGPGNLVLASAVVVILAYGAYRMVLAQPDVSLAGAKAVSEDESAESFSFRDITKAIAQQRHLQVIVAIITITYIVDVMIEYQFNATAKLRYSDARQLTAFLGSFYGIWLNLVTFVLQFFLTAFIVSRFGVGGTLQIMPVTIGLASLGTLLFPGVLSTAAARLSESATRYTFNKTGTELLYLPLPADLRNRTKAFVDIAVDRLARGVGGIILALLTITFGLGVQRLAMVVLALSVVWILLSIVARQEYVVTVRRRLESRRLDLDAARINVTDPATVRLLEETAERGTPRQAAYALTLLGDAPGYRPGALVDRLAEHPEAEVRGKALELARVARLPGHVERAMSEIRAARAGNTSPVIRPAVAYALALGPDTSDLARRLLEHDNDAVVAAAVEGLTDHPELARQLLGRDWMNTAAADARPGRRRVAACAVEVYGDQGTEVLHKLLEDPDPTVVTAACQAAGALKNRMYLGALVRRLADARARGAAIDALAAYGSRIIGSLGDVIDDPSVPMPVRRQVPRALAQVADQRSVDTLLRALHYDDIVLRAATLKALNKLRERAPQLDYGGDSVEKLVLQEARGYYELAAALAPLRESEKAHTAVRLLVRTLEQRLKLSLERVFRLLGLRYPPKDIHAAYVAVQRGGRDEHTAAFDFLDHVLERELKRYLLPLLDEEGQIVRSGQELFDVNVPDARAALRVTIQSTDPWLASCAIAAAAEMGLKELEPEIRPLMRQASAEVAQVAEAAMLALA